MNQLMANFKWNIDRVNTTSGVCEFNKGILRLFVKRIPVHCFGNNNYFYNPTTDMVVAIVGYISNINQICKLYAIEPDEDVKVLERIYSSVGFKFISDLEGVFTILMWDEVRKKGYVFQDEFGSNMPLYYISSPGEFCISTSLKDILRQNIIKRSLNWAAVQDFLVTKYIVPNKNTFINGIYKLPPHRYILINGTKGSVKIKSIYYPHKKVSLNYARGHLMKTLKESVLSSHQQMKSTKRVCTLSSGFDSNIILYYLSAVAEKILAITVGGKQQNEIAGAKKLAGQYKNVNHISSIVDKKKLDHFPNIVWRTEGYVFENGLFLQYELASQLHKNGVSAIMCGEAADQVLDQYRKFSRIYITYDLKSYIRHIIFGEVYPDKHRESKWIKYIRRPGLRINYDIEIDYILKKNGILLNSFGIQSFYPFINRKIIEISDALGKLNNNKSFYKQELHTILDENKLELIEKIGGTTDIVYLFDGYNEIITDIFKNDFFKRLIGHNKVTQILNLNIPERKYEKILRLLYIFLFNKLFISGEFDSKLHDMDLHINLKDLVNNK